MKSDFLTPWAIIALVYLVVLVMIVVIAVRAIKRRAKDPYDYHLRDDWPK